MVDEPLPAPRRAGPLAAVIEGLLVKDPAGRTRADVAEEELRALAGGRTPTRAVTAPPLPDAPTTAALHQPAEPRTPSGAFGPPVTAVSSPADAGDGSRRRRPAYALIAGVAALALTVGGLTYALTDRDDGGSRNDDGPGTAGPAVGGAGAASSGSARPSGAGATGPASGGSSEASAPAGGRSASAPPAQSVKVTLSGRHTHYTGACPPPRTQAPSFTAAFTVGRLPADVEYRWVTETGEVTDGSWKTLSFPEGGGRTRDTTVVATTYDAGGEFADSIGVEVRSPVRTATAPVAFTITCATETPTDGASASASP